VSKAFDRVWLRGLLLKLERYDIKGNLLLWLGSYISAISNPLKRRHKGPAISYFTSLSIVLLIRSGPTALLGSSNEIISSSEYPPLHSPNQNDARAFDNSDKCNLLSDYFCSITDLQKEDILLPDFHPLMSIFIVFQYCLKFVFFNSDKDSFILT
jgi:hypothetical protein